MTEYLVLMSIFNIVLVGISVTAGLVLSDIFDQFELFGAFLFCMIVLVGLAGAGVCNYASYEYGLMQERNKAAEAGVAYYRLDSKTGDTYFEYLEIKKEETNNE